MCTYVCIYICIYIYIYSHTHTYTAVSEVHGWGGEGEGAMNGELHRNIYTIICKTDESESESESHSVMSESLQPHGL